MRQHWIKPSPVAIQSWVCILSRLLHQLNDVYFFSTVNKVIWHIKKDLPLREFMMIFYKRPVAAALYKKVSCNSSYQI